MYERILDKNSFPNKNQINEYIGNKFSEYIQIIKHALEKIFVINMELKFPFGNNYGWGYKVSNKSKHLCYIFFENGCITITLQISKIETEKELDKYNKLSEEGKKYWENRYSCGENGGWIHYRIRNKKHLNDIGKYLSIKTNKEIEL